MGIILEAQVSFFLAFMHSFQKLVSDFGNFQTLHALYGGKKPVRKHYLQMSVWDE